MATGKATRGSRFTNLPATLRSSLIVVGIIAAGLGAVTVAEVVGRPLAEHQTETRLAAAQPREAPAPAADYVLVRAPVPEGEASAAAPSFWLCGGC